MFFLTNGILNKIVSRTVLMPDKPIELPEKLQKLKEMQLLRSNKTIIVQISDITYFEKEEVLCIELYDGSKENQNCAAFLDKNKWSWVDSTFFNFNSKENISECPHRKLTLGSIIILKEYSFEDVITKEEIQNRQENEEYYLQDCLKIKKFFIIGQNNNFKSSRNN